RAASEALIQRGRLAVDERFLVEHRDAGVLHASEGERGREHVLELLKRIWRSEVRGERRERAAHLTLQRVDFHLASTRRTHEKRCGTTGAERGVWSRGEGHEVRRQWLRFGETVDGSVAQRFASRRLPVADRRPGGRHSQRQRESRLEIRLIEAGKEGMRVGRDEERVEEVVPIRLVVEADDARTRGSNAGGEAQRDQIASTGEVSRG